MRALRGFWGRTIEDYWTVEMENRLLQMLAAEMSLVRLMFEA